MKEARKLSLFYRIFSSIAVMLATAMAVLDFTVANVALPYITGSMAASTQEGIYVITAFSIGSALLFPSAGWFAEKLGPVHSLLVALFVFTLSSFLCASALSLWWLVLCRFLQGMSSGLMIPLSQSLVVAIQPKKDVPLFIGIFAMVVLISPVFGPILGGYLCVNYTWRWVFYINLPMGIFSICVIWFLLAPFNFVKKSHKFDFVGFSILLITISSLQIFLDKGNDWDWFNSKILCCAFMCCIIGFCYLIPWSLLCTHPFIDLKLLRHRQFALSNIVVFLTYSFYLGGIVVMPIWLQIDLDYDAFQAGKALAPLGIGALICSIVTSQVLISRIGLIWPMIVGFFIIAASNEYVRFFDTNVDLIHLQLSRLLLGTGLGCLVVPMISMPALSLPQEDLTRGLGLFHFMRTLSGAIGTSCSFTIYFRRSVHQHLNLISSFHEFSPRSMEYMDNIRALDFPEESVLPAVGILLDRQAATIALDEIFSLMSICSLLLGFCLLLFFKKKMPASIKQESLETFE